MTTTTTLARRHKTLPEGLSAQDTLSTQKRLSAQEALLAFANYTKEPAIGFTYSPIAARWFQLDHNGLATTLNGTMPLTGVFELRAFTATHELRWHNISGGTGSTVIVHDAEGPAALPHKSYRRLLWGRVTSTSPGWATLHDSRIGTLPVPTVGTPPVAGSRIWLDAVEYIDVDEHGNVTVLDERLTSLTAEAPKENQ